MLVDIVLDTLAGVKLLEPERDERSGSGHHWRYPAMRVKSITPPLLARFWSYVYTANDCWPWLGPLAGGYGLLIAGQDSMLAHRAAWEIADGEPIPDGLIILHTCDVENCVRNDDTGVYEVAGVLLPRHGHLVRGTVLDNTRDMEAKKRSLHPSGDAHGRRKYPERWPVGDQHPWHTMPGLHPFGERCPQAKVTESAVREIRVRHAASPTTRTIAAICSDYGIARSAVYRIVARKTWRHVV